MQQKVNWRHYVVAVAVVVTMLTAGFKFLRRGYDPPSAPAPAGANPRTKDAPDRAPSPAVTEPASTRKSKPDSNSH